MTRRTLTTLTGAALLAGAASFSVAQPGRGGPEMTRPGHGINRAERPERPERALEGPGADVAMACIESMRDARKAAMTAVRERVQSGVQAVRTLRENGAPDEAVDLAVQQARESIGQAAIRADTAIASAALECVQTLTQNGAEQETIFAVIRAREGNLKAVHFGAMRAGHGLRMASRDESDIADTNDGPRRREGFRGHRGPRGRGAPGAPSDL